MARKQLILESDTPAEETYASLQETANQLARGKTKKDILNFNGVFDKDGRWWVTNTDDLNHEVQLWFKVLTYRTVYFSAKVITFESGRTCVSLTAISYVLFNLFGQLDKPLNIFKEAFVLHQNDQ